jgi:UDP-glucose 4-epimerase
MTVLVTGANGFLGRRVVQAFLHRNVDVRAMARPAASVESPECSSGFEVVRADLRSDTGLDEALEGIDVVVHLAACVAGDDEERFVSTVVGTERLLAAMERAGTRRIVLASTFSVYDWHAISGALDEDSPLESNLYARDGYAIAKFWQEKIVRRAADRKGWDLRVLRPGFIWGEGNVDLAGVGQRFGRLEFVFGLPNRQMPLTHVDNCSDCFATVTLDPNAAGETFNVVDDESISAWRYCGDFLEGTGRSAVRIAIPYWPAYALTLLAQRMSRLLFRSGGKLPSILVPCRFEARFKPCDFTNRKLREQLGWQPPFDYSECLRRTFPRVRQLEDGEIGT